MTRELDYMISRYPEHRGQLIELYENSPNFRSLCDDFWQCHDTLKRLVVMEEKDERLENSCRMLCITLEEEVMKSLQSRS